MRAGTVPFIAMSTVSRTQCTLKPLLCGFNEKQDVWVLSLSLSKERNPGHGELKSLSCTTCCLWSDLRETLGL